MFNTGASYICKQNFWVIHFSMAHLEIIQIILHFNNSFDNLIFYQLCVRIPQSVLRMIYLLFLKSVDLIYIVLLSQCHKF